MIRTYNDMLLDSGIASDFDSFHQFVLFFIIFAFLQVFIEYKELVWAGGPRREGREVPSRGDRPGVNTG